MKKALPALKKIRVAFYLRVSGQEQADQGTIQTQDELLDRRRNEHPEWDVVEIYRDEAVSGTLPFDKRGDGARMMRDARRGHWELLVVYKLDRLARSCVILLNTLEEFGTLNISFSSATEQFDTATPMGRLMMGLLALFAEWERDLIKERSYGGRLRVAGEGKWAGGPPPLGYYVDKLSHFLTVDEEPIPEFPELSEAALMRQMFTFVTMADGSAYSLQDWLNERQIPTPLRCNAPRRKNGQLATTSWRHSTVLALLKNPVYKGELVYGKGTAHAIIRKCAPIVTPELWEHVQVVLAANDKRTDHATKDPYVFNGLMHCASCGHAYCGITQKRKSGKQYRYASCVNRVTKPKTGLRCSSPYVKLDEVERSVWSDLVRWSDHPEELFRAMESERTDPETGERLQAAIDRLSSKISHCEDQRRRNQQSFNQGWISEEQAAPEFVRINHDQEQARAQRTLEQAKLDAWKEQAERQASTPLLLDRVREFLARPEPPAPEDQRALMRAMVRDLTFMSDGTMQVEFRFGPGVQSGERATSRHRP